MDIQLAAPVQDVGDQRSEVGGRSADYADYTD